MTPASHPGSVPESPGGRAGAHARRRFWTRIWMLMIGSALAYVPVALAPGLVRAVAGTADEVAHDVPLATRSGVLTTLQLGEAAGVLAIFGALVIALNLIAWSLGDVLPGRGPQRPTEALRLEHVELCGSVLGVGASMTFVAALLDGLPATVELAAILLFPAVFVIVVLSQDLFLATQRGAGAREILRRESVLLRRRELLTTAARFRPRRRPALGSPTVALGAELTGLGLLTTVAGLLVVVALRREPHPAPVVQPEDVVALFALSFVTVLAAGLLVPWTVRCWLLRRYVAVVLAVAVGGTVYVVLGAGIIWSALDEDAAAGALAATLVLLMWTFLPPAVLLVGTAGIRGRGRFPGVTAALHAALLRERHRLRHAEPGGRAHGTPVSLRHLRARARAVARAAAAG